jgi:hypothetical protein
MVEFMHKIERNCVGLFRTRGVFLHDNARPHTVTRTGSLLEHINWELFDYLPNYPDFAPSDYHLFTYLKNWLRSQRFKNIGE